MNERSIQKPCPVTENHRHVVATDHHCLACGAGRPTSFERFCTIGTVRSLTGSK